MEDVLVGLDVAKLAKENGFYEKCTHYYVVDFNNFRADGIPKQHLTPIEDNHNILQLCLVHRTQPHLASAPTQSLLQKWLREVHSIHIVIQDSINVETRKMRYYPVLFPFGKQYDSIYGPLESAHDAYVYLGDVWKDSYEAALEVGLSNALTLIK